MARYTDADVLAIIRRQHEETGYIPTLRQLRDLLGLASTSTVQNHLRRLVASGALIRNDSDGPGAYQRYRLAE